MDRCLIADVQNRLIRNLSKGYRQRVGLAQAIVSDPHVLILDEPTIGLDPRQIAEIRSLIKSLAGEHTVILSTHILPEVEAVCDRVQIMHHGELVYGDTIAALKQFESGANLLVGLRRPPPPAELAALPGVAAAEAVEPTLYRVQLAAGMDPTDALVKAAAARDWGLYQLRPAQTSLEDVFVHLTRREDVA
ncbi:MAG: AAA family ATPase, partial [Burkholderiales bacterium]